MRMKHTLTRCVGLIKRPFLFCHPSAVSRCATAPVPAQTFLIASVSVCASVCCDQMPSKAQNQVLIISSAPPFPFHYSSITKDTLTSPWYFEEEHIGKEESSQATNESR